MVLQTTSRGGWNLSSKTQKMTEKETLFFGNIHQNKTIIKILNVKYLCVTQTHSFLRKHHVCGWV